MEQVAEWETVGHEFTKQVLTRQLELERIPHAYIFVGPEGVGKKTLAREMAFKLGAFKHSILELDFKSSDTEALRSFLVRLALKPQAGARQVAILDSAELMHVASSNTLLKILEEPPASTVIILIATKRNLPATVVSRCQVMDFGYLNRVELEQISTRLGVVFTEDAHRMACGRASEFLKLSLDTSELEKLRAWAEDLKVLTTGSMFAKLALIQEWSKQEALEAENRLSFWISRLIRVPGTEQRARELAVLFEGLRRLGTNGNKKLVLEYLCLNLG